MRTYGGCWSDWITCILDPQSIIMLIINDKWYFILLFYTILVLITTIFSFPSLQRLSFSHSFFFFLSKQYFEKFCFRNFFSECGQLTMNLFVLPPSSSLLCGFFFLFFIWLFPNSFGINLLYFFLQRSVARLQTFSSFCRATWLPNLCPALRCPALPGKGGGGNRVRETQNIERTGAHSTVVV